MSIEIAESENRPRLGELLVHAGLIPEQVLEDCLRHQWRWGGRIGEILVEQGHVTPAQLIWALAIQLNLESIDLDSYLIDNDAVAMLPNSFARAHRCIAIQFEERAGKRHLVVATADPTIQNLAGQIEHTTQLPTIFKIASEDAIWDAIGAYYRHQESIIPQAVHADQNRTDITSLLTVPPDIASRIYTAEAPQPNADDSITQPTQVALERTQELQIEFTPEMILSLEPHQLVELARKLIAERRLFADDLKVIKNNWFT